MTLGVARYAAVPQPRMLLLMFTLKTLVHSGAPKMWLGRAARQAG